MINRRTVYINPTTKPRMTQRDKWKKRPCVLKYFSFRDEIRSHKIYVPNFGATVVFHVEMPKSWSNKKKDEMNGEPHQQVPDIDNYLKSFLDAVFDDDKAVFDIRPLKFWSTNGSIDIFHDEKEELFNFHKFIRAINHSE